MASYGYVARDSRGEEVSGFLSGNNSDEVVSQLHGQGLVVLHVAEDRGQRGVHSFKDQLAAISFGNVKTRELALFSRQFSTVLEAGIPLVRGLRGLAADSTSKVLSRALSDISYRIERGEGLSDAMAAHPEAFNGMYMSMIRAGERAGTLDEIIEQLAVYLEKVDEIKTKVRSAMSYPVFTLAFAVVAVLFLLIKIVPTFSQIYADLNTELPALTRWTLAVSSMIQHNALLSLAVTLLLILGLLLWGRTRGGRYLRDSFFLKMPIFGPIVRKAVMSRFARTFGILMKSGLPILDSLELVGGSTGNSVVERSVAEVREKVAAGAPITRSFRETGKYPEMVLQLMSTGEESGDLDEMLLKASDFYDRQVEAAVHGLASLVEPVMIVLVGGLIGLIVVSMFLPIFYLGEAVMQGGFNL